MRPRPIASVLAAAAAGAVVLQMLRWFPFSDRDPLSPDLYAIPIVVGITVWAVAGYRRSRGKQTDIFRVGFASLIGYIALLATTTAGCNDVGGVSDWERCTSSLGNPILEWPGVAGNLVFPLLIAGTVGFGVWWLLGRGHRNPSSSS